MPKDEVELSFASMQLRADGRTRVLYQDTKNRELRRAQSSTALISSVSLEDVLLLSNSSSHAAMLVDDADGFHHVHVAASGSLEYFGSARISAGQFVVEAVDTGLTVRDGVPFFHRVGADVTLLSPTGQSDSLVAVYQDATELDVKVAQRHGDNDWRHAVIAGSGLSAGFFVSAALCRSPELLVVAHQIVDRAAGSSAIEILTMPLAELP